MRIGSDPFAQLMGVSRTPQANPVTPAASTKRHSTTYDVPPTRTAVDRGQIRDALSRAYTQLHGRPPTRDTLATLTAHVSHETASGSSMYNYNFGGIKGSAPDGATARCQTKEVYSGKEVSVVDGFRAYKSIDQGATDYLLVMESRFGGAMREADKGDVTGFAHALKQSHYYTANEDTYAAALRAHAGIEAKSGASSGAVSGSGPGSGTSGAAPPDPLVYANLSRFVAMGSANAANQDASMLDTQNLRTVLSVMSKVDTSSALIGRPMEVDDAT